MYSTLLSDEEYDPLLVVYLTTTGAMLQNHSKAELIAIALKRVVYTELGGEFLPFNVLSEVRGSLESKRQQEFDHASGTPPSAPSGTPPPPPPPSGTPTPAPTGTVPSSPSGPTGIGLPPPPPPKATASTGTVPSSSGPTGIGLPPPPLPKATAPTGMLQPPPPSAPATVPSSPSGPTGIGLPPPPLPKATAPTGTPPPPPSGTSTTTRPPSGTPPKTAPSSTSRKAVTFAFPPPPPSRTSSATPPGKLSPTPAEFASGNLTGFLAGTDPLRLDLIDMMDRNGKHYLGFRNDPMKQQVFPIPPGAIPWRAPVPPSIAPPRIYGAVYPGADYAKMIGNPAFADSLFIFNDNVGHHQTVVVGGGNGAFRPYNNYGCYRGNPWTAGIPTGAGSGYRNLTEGQAAIDAAIAEIKALIQHHRYGRIFYSAETAATLQILGLPNPVPKLGVSIYKPGQDVIDYITQQIFSLGVPGDPVLFRG